MRLLHTSDWHLGRSFHGTGMLDTQREFITALIGTIRTENIDVLLISGDVYDRALPASDAVEVFDDALARIREAGAIVVITAGNHDSATRLGFGGRLMGAAGVHVRTRSDTVQDPVCVEIDGTTTLIYGIPYLEPRLISTSWQTPSHHTGVLTEAMTRIRADLEQQRAARGPVTSIVMAHVFAAGASGSDSERDIGAEQMQGGLGQVAASVFDGVDYAALGHLHGRQKVSESVRYSGSPLRYSFSEARQAKGGWILTIGTEGIESIDPVQWPVGRALKVLESDIEDLLNNPDYADAEDAWCQITVTDAQRPPQAYPRLKQRFPGLLNFILAPRGPRPTVTSYAQKLDDAVTDVQMCTDFVEHVRTRPASEAETVLFTEALEHGRIQEAEARR